MLTAYCGPASAIPSPYALATSSVCDLLIRKDTGSLSKREPPRRLQTTRHSHSAICAITSPNSSSAADQTSAEMKLAI